MTQSATTVGAVQTVLGPIAPERLGLVLPHEHILCDVTPPELKTISDREVEITFGNAHEIRYHWIKHYGNHVLNDRDVAADEVARFGSAGGGTIVELTVCGIHPRSDRASPGLDREWRDDRGRHRLLHRVVRR